MQKIENLYKTSMSMIVLIALQKLTSNDNHKKIVDLTTQCSRFVIKSFSCTILFYLTVSG
ncbi:hypothetical protein EZS27_012704 [termite gut metagenome]|uniref:Uncharacterized protein n=1 Tax=termite gut metagenome TaxID=433724 RepID=A0A5J4RZV1_9ZZZZ